MLRAAIKQFLTFSQFLFVYFLKGRQIPLKTQLGSESLLNKVKSNIQAPLIQNSLTGSQNQGEEKTKTPVIKLYQCSHSVEIYLFAKTAKTS